MIKLKNGVYELVNKQWYSDANDKTEAWHIQISCHHEEIQPNK